MAQCLLLSFALISIKMVAAAGPVVRTDDGPIQGMDSSDAKVSVFHGVPFASPPVGALRWTDPAPAKPWTETRQATKPGAYCPQMHFTKKVLYGAEDCLYLSVYAPKQCTRSSPCATMQFIYGGGWITGDDVYGGVYDATQFAADHGVVVVAANYRLDTFGWMALQEQQDESTDSSFGNFGLKDQRAAMKWTQRNIRQFGGDPTQLTIFGESAGAWSVCQHLVSPGSNRLFSRAIMESGDCAGPWMVHDGPNAKRFSDAYASASGCPAGKDRMGCLRRLSPDQALLPWTSWLCFHNKSADPFCNKSMALTQAASDWPDSLYSAPNPPSSSQLWPTPLPPLAPVIAFTAVVDGSQSGLPDDPLRLIQAGRVNVSPSGDKISVMMGTNKDEFALFLAAIRLVIPEVKLPARAHDLQLVAGHMVKFHEHWNATTTNQIVAQYTNSSVYKTWANMIIAAGTDLCFRCGTRAAARALSALSLIHI
eukprot:TRINITY_DN4618_c0_g1_i1.p1 TRINITY_DN4618_c0_g1~~TRINITY_DN4618_c0_g1_i1.p1  ORF type:complete len:480 (+),score=88.82 TRINITY_DN4618_c0_g1_i1:211-1650(+)